MSEFPAVKPVSGFPAVQLSSFISGDQWVFRADSGDDLKGVLESVAGSADASISALNALKQVGIANGVFSGDSTKGSGGGGSKPAERKSDSGPPSSSGGGEVCQHGPMKDFSGRGYKNRWYCPAKNRDEQCRARP